MIQFLKKFFSKSKEKKVTAPFAIISNNCWGGEIYREYSVSYNTPFIGLFVYAQDYIKLLENFSEYISMPLGFTEKSKWIDNFNYPVGLLGDVEIHFLHYKSKEEAAAKWSRRLNRLLEVPQENWFYKICDRDGGKEDIIKRFHSLNFNHKLSFAIYDFDNANHVKVLENENSKTVEDGVLLYKVTHKYIDILYWINNKSIKRVL